MTPESFVRFASPVADHHGMAALCVGYGQEPLEVRACRWRQLPTHGAVLVTDGAGWFEAAGMLGRRQVRANTLLWLFPGVPHRYAPEPWWAEQWVLFTGALIEQYERAGLFTQREPVVEVSGITEVAQTFDEIGAAFRSGRPLTAVYAGALVPRVVMAVHDHTRRRRGEDDGPRQGSSYAVRRLAESALAEVNLEDVARSCGMSPATFRRRVRQETGSSPIDFVTRVRMDAAKHLLATSDLAVQRVGAAVGYYSPNYFTRMFTTREGMSPGAFRSQQQRESLDKLDLADRCVSSGGRDDA